MGPHTLIIKRGEYGAILFRRDAHFMVPGYLLEDVFDPTGAGDSFAGGFIGYLAGQGICPSQGDLNPTELRRALIRRPQRACTRKATDRRRDAFAVPPSPSYY